MQPKHSASSTDSDQVMLDYPVPTSWKPTSNSVAVPAWASNHCRKAAAVGQKVGRLCKGAFDQTFESTGHDPACRRISGWLKGYTKAQSGALLKP